MTINPYSSPYYKPNNFYIDDILLYRRWMSIRQHLTSPHVVVEYPGEIVINNHFRVATRSAKMRLISHLDWVFYTPRDLAAAMDSNTVDVYYEQQLLDSQSDPNVWKDVDKEIELKTRYAVQAGRASLLK